MNIYTGLKDITEAFQNNSPPVEVKSEQAKAEYKDGILTVTVPKVETTQMKGKKIDIH